MASAFGLGERSPKGKDSDKEMQEKVQMQSSYSSGASTPALGNVTPTQHGGQDTAVDVNGNVLPIVTVSDSTPPPPLPKRNTGRMRSKPDPMDDEAAKNEGIGGD